MTRRIAATGTRSSSATCLGQRGADVLADLDLAGVDGDLAVLVDVQPGGEVSGEVLGPARAAGLLGEEGRAGRGQSDRDAAADELQEPPAVEIEPMEARDLVLRQLPIVAPAAHPGFPFFAADCTAWRIRGYTQHRQTLRASVPEMSSSLGLGFDFRSATEATIMPGVQ